LSAKRIGSAVSAITAASIGILFASSLASASSQPYPTRPPASQFVQVVDNPWFPLKPGTTSVYNGEKDGHAGTDVVQVTRRTRLISGVQCTEVEDTLLEHGHVEEHTLDWYAQTRNGDVWYYGEKTAEYDAKGTAVSRAGSWRDGLNGAHAGIFFLGHPKVGRQSVQEYDAGNADDHQKVVQRGGSVTVPYGTFDRALSTHEWTPLEPGVLDRKVYVPGLGDVLEETLRGGSERWELSQVIHD
jgi:hypothetical protein